MPSQPNYRGYRFPPEIISHTVWLYHRFTLSLGDIEDLLAERNVIVSYDSIRRSCATFGLDYARRLPKRRGALGDRWFLDEVTVSIQGKRQYLWRAVDQDVTSWISSCKAAKTSAPPSISSVNSKKFNSKSPTS